MTEKMGIVIVGAAIVTYGTRVLPFFLLRNRTLPNWFQEWMAYIPVALFSALIASDVFYVDGVFNWSMLQNPKIIPAIGTAFLAWRTKNMIVTIIGGLVLMIVVQSLL